MCVAVCHFQLSGAHEIFILFSQENTLTLF